jgi:PAS domain S-box-containing protein
MSINNSDYYFLKGGGEMGELIRAKDWSKTSLGDPLDWPQSLRTMVAVMLDNPFGMYIAWGSEYIQLYNDGYRPILGATKHPQALGISTRETFSEIWHIIESMFDGVMNGKAVGFPDFMLPLNRNGFVEKCYFDFSYSPIRNDDGKVGGVLVTVIETTNKKKAEDDLKESNHRFRNTVKQAPVGITILRGPQYIVEMANNAYLQLVDRTEAEFVGKPLFDGLPEVEESVHFLLDNVMNTGVPYHGNEVPVPINRHGKKEIFYFDFLYHPLKEEDGNISGVMVIVTEVTEKVEARKKTEQNEERLNIVIEASELGTWELNLKTKAPQYSKRFLEIVGDYSNDLKLTHEQLLHHLHPDDVPVREQAFTEAVATGYLSYESRLIWEDKSIHWIQARGKVFYDAENRPEKIIGTLRDITKEKLYSQTLLDSEQRFRDVIMQSPVAKAILKGKDHIIEMANEALLKGIWRKNENEVLGMKILDVFPELREQRTSELLDEVYSTGNKYTQRESLISLNGKDGLRRFYVDIEYAPVFYEDNKISGIKITAIDVTEKVEARKKIEESEARFRSLAESLPQLVWETDEKGNSLFASHRWKEYTGLMPGGEAEWKAIIHPDDFDENAETWKHCLATGDLYRCDVRIKSKDGEYRWHRVIGEPVLDKEDRIIKWVGAFTDIHTQKAFTQELEKQVAERTKELADTNMALGRMNKELQSFAYISSHDLQEPLRKIQTFSSQIIQRESQNLSDSGKDKFLRMQNSAKRMQNLIDDLLTYSRTSSADRKFESVDLKSIIDEVKDDLKEELQQKHAIIEAHETCEANIIPFQFRQLLFNLVNNSLKFSDPSVAPRIVIKSKLARGAEFKNDKLDKELKYCHIRIADNGIGFEQQYSDKIFEVFQRLHGKNQYDGTGIGLSIVKRIVENHNGVITASGELNKGATFDIYIPAL